MRPGIEVTVTAQECTGRQSAARGEERGEHGGQEQR